MHWYEVLWELQLESHVSWKREYGFEVDGIRFDLSPAVIQAFANRGAYTLKETKILEIPVELLSTELLIAAREKFTGEAVADKMSTGTQISKTRKWRIKRLANEIEKRQELEAAAAKKAEKRTKK
jgi:hypothetical protein